MKGHEAGGATCFEMWTAAGVAERGLVAHWRINGYRATIHVWTDRVFRALAEPPRDAQYYECGVWCALRLED